MVKLLQFGFILLVAFFCVSVPSASAAPIKSVTGCGWKTDLTAVGFNLLSQIDDRFDQFAIRIKCQKTCTELELEFNNGGINSLEVCFKAGKPCVRGTVHRCSSTLVSYPVSIPIGDQHVALTLQTNLYDCLSFELDQCVSA
ncbi:hypothetical protein EMCRGX_G033484 [Ephydatia muelleri]